MALHAEDRTAIASLFTEECHWRDLVAMTWTISPHIGRAAVVDGLLRAQVQAKASCFRASGKPDAAAPGEPGRGRRDRGYFRIRDCFGPRTRRGPAPGRCAEAGLGADDLARGAERVRGTNRPSSTERRQLRAHLRRPELGRSAGERTSVRGSRACCPHCRRRAGGADDGGEAPSAGRGHARDRYACAGRRQLAHSLSLAGAAQPGRAEPHALPAVPAELAEIPAEGHDRRLVGNLCLGDGM